MHPLIARFNRMSQRDGGIGQEMVDVLSVFLKRLSVQNLLPIPVVRVADFLIPRFTESYSICFIITRSEYQIPYTLSTIFFLFVMSDNFLAEPYKLIYT